MNRRATVVLALVFGGFFVVFLAFLGLAYTAVRSPMGHHFKATSGGPKIGVVELKGIIGDDRGGVQGSKEAEEIRDFGQDDDIKAIVVRINSPGGAVAPSQEIWEEIIRTRKKKKVVCSQGSVAASGAYYISVACDQIVADAGTLTGSIGVISQFFSAQDLLPLAHLQETTLKTGLYKDSGSPFRAFTEQDRTYFTGLMDGIYEQFVKAVADGRHKTVEEVRLIADGRVFSGEKAKEMGLVDEVGNFRTAIDRAMKLAGVEGEPELIYPEKKNEWILDMLRNDARAVGSELVHGAIDGAQAKSGLENGVLFLAPGLAPSL